MNVWLAKQNYGATGQNPIHYIYININIYIDLDGLLQSFDVFFAGYIRNNRLMGI
jgi:hypothetical protein